MWQLVAAVAAVAVAVIAWLLRHWDPRPVSLTLRDHIRRVLKPRVQPVHQLGRPGMAGPRFPARRVGAFGFEERRAAVLALLDRAPGPVARPDAAMRVVPPRMGVAERDNSSDASLSSSSSVSAAFSFQNDALDSPSQKALYNRYMPNARKLYDMLGYAYQLNKDNLNEPMESGSDEAGYIPGDVIGDYLRSSRTSSLDENIPRQLGDFNERFQAITETMASFGNDTPLAIRIRAGRDLINLSQDFIFSSTAYGRIIISEAFLPDDEKTIKPCNVQLGLAGGTKFIVGNILFKFAMDTHGLLGSDFAAAKVAGHELKYVPVFILPGSIDSFFFPHRGLLSVFNANVTGLSVPLMALVDYRGFRLIAMSILPIDSSTIRTGSNNYGQAVHDDVSERDKTALETMAARLNIKPHYCGIGNRRPAKVYGPVDLEGHVAPDGRFYLLDFSRVMPPETPKPGMKMAHLYRLLRPEFVRLYEKPLCSDGYSAFIKAHDAGKHNREIAKATLLLTTELIPSFAPELSDMFLGEVAIHGWRVMETFRVSEALHRRGINIRYLGLIRKHTMNGDVRTFLLIEIFARVVKNLLRLQLREKMKALRLPLEEPYRRLVVDYLNLILGESENSDRYWNTVIRRNVKINFADALTQEEARDDFYLKSTLTYFSHPESDGKYLLFTRIASMAGLEVSPALQRDLQLNPNSWAPRGEEPFDDGDLMRIDVRIKHMNIITHTLGVQYLHRANAKYGREPAAAERLLKLAMERFTEALDTDPRNPDTLCNLALVSMRLMECSSSALSNTIFDERDSQVQTIQGYFLRAVSEAPNDSRILGLYAGFLEKVGRFVEAEELYIRSLEIDPHNDASLLDYGNFLSDRGQFELAEKLFLKIRQAQ